MDNRVVLTGVVHAAPGTRISPAGIPMVRFTIEHLSLQEEAGLGRQVRCSVEVVLAGEALSREADGLQQGEQVRITGFLSRAGSRSERLVIHGQRLDRLPNG